MSETATLTEAPAALTPMTPGGIWMVAPGENMPPVYVVAREHQHRLMTRSQEEGGPWYVVPDPRDPQAVRVKSEEADLVKRLAELQAMRAQKMREHEMRAQIAALEAELLPPTPSEPVAPEKAEGRPAAVSHAAGKAK